MHLERLGFAVVTCFALSTLAAGCKKEEPPPPAPTATDEDEPAPKKKKKSADDDEPMPEVGSPTSADDPTGVPPTVAVPKGNTAKADAGAKSQSEADKAKLQACCTALRNAAQAAKLGEAVAEAGLPGMPTPPAKEELDKAVAECDKAVIAWTGDLNESLKKVKNATPVRLPSVCNL